MNQTKIAKKIHLSIKLISAAFLFFLISPTAGLWATPETNISPSQAASISNEKISLDLKGMDTVETLKILSTRGNINMVIGGNIQSRVTLFLKDVDIQDALEIILISSNLAYEWKGDILYIMPQKDYEQIYGQSFGGKKDMKTVSLKNAKAADIAKSLETVKTRLGKVIVDDASNTLVLIDNPDTVLQMEEIVKKLDQPATSRVFELKYAKATDIKAKISDMLTKGVGSLQVDERTNKVAVIDIETKLNEIEKVITEFDAQPKQVLIEAKIVQIALKDQYKLGVDWQDIFRSMNSRFNLRNNFSIVPQGTFGTGFSSGGEAVIGTFGKTNYAMLIQALKTIGDSNLLSSPRITAINNQEAKILVGESRPYATNTVVTPGGGAATTTASALSFLDIGIKLYVTPTINRDNFVTMKIKPEVSSSSSDYTYGSPPTTVPIVSTTQAETSVRVKDGTTIIIAGLIKDDRSGTVNKLPLAGDLPLLGNLFKKTDNQIQKQELVIFITPHIISGDLDYVEIPETPPTGDGRFTMKEAWTYERRNPTPMDPTLFKNPLKSKAGNAKANPSGMTKISKPASLEEYYYAVKDSILANINFDSGTKVPKGSIKISFRLSSQGALVSAPYVKQSSNKALDQPAIDAVQQSAPFPPFPEAISQPEKEFIIDFVFE